MNNEIKEDMIILLNEARNKISKAIIMYSKYDKDDVYLQAIKDLLNNEIKDLTKEYGKDYERI